MDDNFENSSGNEDSPDTPARTLMVSRYKARQLATKGSSTTGEQSATSPFDTSSGIPDSEDTSPSETEIKEYSDSVPENGDSNQGEGDDDDEEDIETVQIILGKKDPYGYKKGPKKEQEEEKDLYFVKFNNKSYKHCKWMTDMDLLITPGGEIALKKFKTKNKRVSLTHSLSFSSLLTFDENSVNSQWFEIDRIIDDRTVNGKREFFIKWKSLEYEDATWEDENFLDDKVSVEKYFERRSHFNLRKIPARWQRPSPETFKPIIKAPFSKKTGDVLRDYQLEGLNWLRFCWYNQRNSILADEMGLGKTVQIVTTLNDLSNSQSINGPFLIVAPLSTLPHWKNEFDRWSDFNSIIYHGSMNSRQIIEETEFDVKDELGRVNPARIGCDVVITTYETISKSFNLFSSIEWRYLVADEGHKLKNYKGKRYKIIQKLHFEHCTLLTGTPIQNDMTELWSLLHFLQPENFKDIDGFMAKYGIVTDSSQVQEIQSIIQPLLLRRKKIEVEKSLAPKEETIISVELTRIQKTFYRAFIHENASTLLQQITNGSLPSLQNLMMQLRKVCNHPFLINGAEEGIVNEMSSDEKNKDLSEEEVRNKALVDSSGKMVLLDKLLPKLKTDGHKVLIFSQMVRVLDIIEDYLHQKNYQYERIDGTLNENDRRTSIDRFNEDHDNFVFLLSTKAGGVGINLTAADTVVIYDSDWNPQNDIQAQARCHRIGQTATVKVYRLLTRGTYENEMFERASKKLGLDHVVLDGGDMSQAQPMKPDEIEKILRNGAYGIFQDDNSETDNFISQDIDQILERRAKPHVMEASGDGSVFSKTTFKTSDESTSKGESVEFWSQVIPENTDEPEDDENKILRKCRKEKIDQENDLNDVENGFRIAYSLIDRGFTYSAAERKVIRIAYTIKSPLDDVNSTVILNKFIHCRLDEKDDDEEIVFTNYETLVNQFGEIALTVIEKTDKIIDRVVFFARLIRALEFVQGDKFYWPEVKPVWEDPFSEYSLMYGINKHGWKNYAHLFEDNDLLLHHSKRLSSKEVESRIESLIEILETQYDISSFDTRRDFEPDDPLAWRERHSGLQAREVLYNHELFKLFNTIKFYGIKENLDGKPDLKLLKENAEIENVSDGLLLRTIEILKEFTTTVKSESDTLNFDGFPDIEPLQNLIKAKDVISFARTIEVMRAINKFVDNYSPESEMIISKAPKNIHLPSWWTPEHDNKMAFAIHEHGTVFVSTWIVDPKLPFRQYIGDDLISSFEKAAEKEKKRRKLVRPPKLGDFSFIYRKRSRLARVMMAVEYVNKRLEKDNKRNVDNALYELVISPSLRIVSFGEYTGDHSRFGICPIGFTSERLFGETSKAWYRCEIEKDEKGKLSFVVMRKNSSPEDENPTTNDPSTASPDINSNTSTTLTPTSSTLALNSTELTPTSPTSSQNSSTLTQKSTELTQNSTENSQNSTELNQSSTENSTEIPATNTATAAPMTKYASPSPILSWKMALETEDRIPGSRVTGVSLFGLSNKRVKARLVAMKEKYKDEHPEFLEVDHGSVGTQESDNAETNNIGNANFHQAMRIVDFVIPVLSFDRAVVREAILDDPDSAAMG